MLWEGGGLREGLQVWGGAQDAWVRMLGWGRSVPRPLVQVGRRVCPGRMGEGCRCGEGGVCAPAV